MTDTTDIMDAVRGLLLQQSQSQEHQLRLILEGLAGNGNAHKERTLPRLNVPDFYGKPAEDVNSWLFILQQNFEATGTPTEKRPLIASAYLRDAALQWYRHHTLEHGGMAYEEFCQGMQTMFLPHNHQELLRDKLDALKQRGKMEAYVTEYMALINQVQDMSEADKIHAFKRGLAPKTRAQVGYVAPKTLQAAIELAQGYDSNFFASRGQDVQERAHKQEWWPRRAHDREAYVPMETNSAQAHYAPARRDAGARRAPEGKAECTYCGRKYHVESECHKKAYDQRNKAEVNAYATESRRPELMCVDAHINGVLVSCLVDTGANTSLVSPQTAVKCGLKVHRAHIKIRVADGTEVEGHGTVHQVGLTVGTHHVTMDLGVVPLGHQAILGMDFLKKSAVRMDIKQGSLRFPGICIKAKKTHEDQSEDMRVHTVVQEGEPIDTPGQAVKTEASIEDVHYEQELWPTGIKCTEYKICDTLSVKEKCTILELLDREKEGFADNMSALQASSLEPYQIHTTSEKPVYAHPYRKSLKERTLMQIEVQKMLEAGIIRASTSPWSAPVILIEKPDGSSRFCTDYRELNKVTTTDAFPLPRMDDIFDRLTGSKIFSTLDLKAGYWQIRLDAASQAKSAFSTPDGHYEYLRLPFGLKNAPAAFSRQMHTLLGHMRFVEIYLDDITVHSKTFAEHVGHLQQVLTTLRRVKLRLNKEKCSFAQTRIHLLGHVISADGIQVDTRKTKAVQEIQAPRNIKELQRFLGMTGYYRKFMAGYAGVAAPLYGLLKSDTTWTWGNEQQVAFRSLKEKLIQAPVLRLPDLQRPFRVHTDASGHALGAVLAQVDDEGHEYACAYESRLLKGPERNYGISEQECLGIVWAIRKLRPYLHGARFELITDHSALKWLMSIREPTSRLTRWAIYLQAYDFEIIHRKGTAHTNVDILSRPRMEEQPAAINAVTTRSAKPRKQDAQQEDKDVQQGKGTEKESAQRILPRKDDRHALIEKAHLLGHFKATATRERLRDLYEWPGMAKEVDTFIQECKACNRHDTGPKLDRAARVLSVGNLFDRVGIDCVFGLPKTKEGYIGILVLTEYLSRFPYAVPIRTKTAEEVASHLIQYMALFGPPRELLSDQGREFLNQVVDKVSKSAGIERKVTSAYHPRTNGLTERFNQTLIKAICCHSEKDPRRWHEWIPFVLLAYRTKRQSSTGHTPFEIMFGRAANHFLPWEEGSQGRPNDGAEGLEQRALEIRTLVEDTRPLARAAIERAQRRQVITQNGRTHKVANLTPGTMVYLKNMGLLTKLQPKYSGPYQVEATTEKGNYWLKNTLGNRLPTSYPPSRLKVVQVKRDKETYEVERIIEHRVSEGNMEYRIRWKGYTAKEDTWEPEDHIDTPECIQEYWASLEAVTEDSDETKPGDMSQS